MSVSESSIPTRADVRCHLNGRCFFIKNHPGFIRTKYNSEVNGFGQQTSNSIRIFFIGKYQIIYFCFFLFYFTTENRGLQRFFIQVKYFYTCIDIIKISFLPIYGFFVSVLLHHDLTSANERVARFPDRFRSVTDR